MVPRLFDVPHPGKLRLRQGRWNLSELDSASSDGTSSCRASLVSVLSLHTCVHVCVQPHSHRRIHTHTHTSTHTNALCVLRFCTLCRHIYNAMHITHTFSICKTYSKRMIKNRGNVSLKHAKDTILFNHHCTRQIKL